MIEADPAKTDRKCSGCHRVSLAFLNLGLPSFSNRNFEILWSCQLTPAEILMNSVVFFGESDEGAGWFTQSRTDNAKRDGRFLQFRVFRPRESLGWFLWSHVRVVVVVIVVEEQNLLLPRQNGCCSSHNTTGVTV